jgi:HipA-like C-terminal domain
LVDPIVGDDAQRALLLLRQRGVLSSAELQALLGKSQPTVSRLMAQLSAHAVVLGSARSTRYAAAQNILGFDAEQPIAWVHEEGRVDADWGHLTFIAGDRVHVRAPAVDVLAQGTLPWFLAPLRPTGFLGRLLAQRLALQGADANPERWSLAQVLFVALHTFDGPGALVLGTWHAERPRPVPLTGAGAAAAYDQRAADVAANLPAGSSAGREQAKFLAQVQDRHVLVKFSPPRGTPFGERWHDLLHAEHLALAVLRQHGVRTAATTIVETAHRTHLESTRFDRIGTRGRRHAVALDAVHDAFVPGSRRNWGATCDALAAQRRLPATAPAQARALQQFGRLIGNTDMHFGNLSLAVDREGLARGHFTLAPLYDMLPMRWRPDAISGELGLVPFTPDEADLSSAARSIALEFWQRVAEHGATSRGFRVLAGEMAQRMR